MQFQVPQFIETEDKIVGPFTLKQFLYVASAGGLSFMLYFMVQTWLWALLSVFIVSGGLALAFLKINGRAFPAVLLSMFSFYWKPQMYVWQSENPHVKKEEALRSSGIQDIISGLLLKNTLQHLQTGTRTTTKRAIEKARNIEERYQIFQRLTGERQAARRIDYR